MSSALKPSRKLLPHAPWGALPEQLRLLAVGAAGRGGAWLAEAFAGDSACDVLLQEAAGAADGLARVREEPFDAVLACHEPGEFDALEFVEALRTGGSFEPAVVLGRQGEPEMLALCHEVQADAYACLPQITARSLLWTIARAIERQQLLRENFRLAQAERQRLQRDHNEAQRLLDQQRQMLWDLEALRRTAWGPSVAGAAAEEPSHDHPLELPPQLITHYQELLRAYVIMGSGNLGAEMSLLAEMLAAAGVSARQTMRLHLAALEELLQGLGTRSTRHVMNRADLLVLEVVVHLAERYRQRYQERIEPAKQQLLPGFDAAA